MSTPPTTDTPAPNTNAPEPPTTTATPAGPAEPPSPFEGVHFEHKLGQIIVGVDNLSCLQSRSC